MRIWFCLSKVGLGFAVLLGLALSIFSQTSIAQQQPAQPQVVPGEFVVKLKSDAQGEHLRAFTAKFGHRAKLHLAAQHLNIHHFKVTDGTADADMLAELNQNPHVIFAEPNYILKMSGGAPTYTQDYANVQVTQAWTYLSGTTAVVVAVLDTGIDLTHTVFTGSQSIWVNKNEIANNGIDDDGNGFIDDVNGWNFAYGTNNPNDDNGHGTHVSGIVMGLGQNIFATTLTVSNIKIMPLKFMDSSGSGTTSNAVAAIDYAISNGARLINNSWGGSGYSQALNDALTAAYNHSMFIGSAAGNYSSNDDSSLFFPASLPIPGQMTVAASDVNDNLSYYSSYGPGTVQVSAPGDNIASTWPGSQFAYLSGTSMATPFVTGLAALMMTQAPQLTGYQVKQLIIKSVNVGAQLHGYVSTSGRVNALQAVLLAQQSIATQAYQPVYVETVPAGAQTGTTTTQSSSSGGCGTVSTALLSSSFWSGGGGSGGYQPQALALLVGFLFLPLLVWTVVRSRWLQVGQRKHDRFVFQSQVKVLVDGKVIDANLATLGAGGVSFFADQKVKKGEVISLEIPSPNGSGFVKVSGRIVWTSSGQAHGVQFGPMREALLHTLLSWTVDLPKAA